MEKIRQRTVRYPWKIQLTFNLVMLALAIIGVILRVVYGETFRWALYGLVGLIAVLFICRVVIMRFRVVFRAYEFTVRPMIGSDVIYDIDEVDTPVLTEDGRLLITRKGETIVDLKPNCEGFQEAVSFLKDYEWFSGKNSTESKSTESVTILNDGEEVTESAHDGNSDI